MADGDPIASDVEAALAEASARPVTAPSSEPQRGTEPRDKHGETFRPERHQADAQGRPLLDGRGRLKIRPGTHRRSRTGSPQQGSAAHRSAAPGQGTPHNIGASVPPGAGYGQVGDSPRAAGAEELRAQTVVLAAQIVDQGLGAVQILLGPEWRPVRRSTGPGGPEMDERAAWIDAVAAVLEARGIREVTPELGLLLVAVAYAVSPEPDTRPEEGRLRIMGRTTRERLGMLWSAIAGAWPGARTRPGWLRSWLRSRARPRPTEPVRETEHVQDDVQA